MRFGIVGTGFISDWFVAACRLAGGTPTAVYSRDRDRGVAFAARHGLTFAFGSLDELVKSPSVDAVYVASPIAAHTRQVACALTNGKHVLCEKTMGTSPEEVASLYRLSDQNDTVLLEAIRPTHDPASAVIKAALPRLGAIRSAHIEKCQYSSRYAPFLRGEVLNAFNPASGNSALRDLGVYCLHPCLTMFGNPLSFTGADYHLANGFQAGGTAVLNYGSMSATCTYSKIATTVLPSVIEGERGSLTIDSIAEPAQVTFTDHSGHSFDVLAGLSKHPHETLHHPIEEFLRLCEGNMIDHPYRAQTLTAEVIISALLSSDGEPEWTRLANCAHSPSAVHDRPEALTRATQKNKVITTNLYTHMTRDVSQLGDIIDGQREERP